MYTPSHIYFYRALELYLSPEFLLNFVLNLHIPPRMGNIFKFVVFILLENVFCESEKLKIDINTHVFPGKTLPRSLSSQEKLSLSFQLPFLRQSVITNL